MNVVKPEYYDRFSCEAGACSFTCCQDWKITVDEKTKESWKCMECPSSMNNKKCLADFVRQAEDADEIILNADGKCPFLDEDKLCHLVKAYGEECLSHTCHTFPRETHEHEMRIEYALSVGCPAVLKLLWEKDRFDAVDKDGATSQKGDFSYCEDELLFALRDWFMEIVADESMTVPEAMQLMYYIALDIFEREEEEPFSWKLYHEYHNDSSIDEALQLIKGMEIDSFEAFLERNELLLDLAENYRKKKIYEKDLEPIAKLAEEYEALLTSEDMPVTFDHFPEKRAEFLFLFEGFEQRLRTLLVEEIYSSCLLADGDLYSMVMKLQWIAIEYAVICQWSYLHYDLYGELGEESFMQLVAVIFRMTGYSEADIEDYLYDSFKQVIWDWGYFALIVGK